MHRPSVAIVDYGMGNLRSVQQAVLHGAEAGLDVVIAQQPEQIRAAERVILPGQGAMRDCMQHLRDSGMMEALREAAASKPFFGVCVGMQMLLQHSEEGDTASLGLIPGEVRRFRLEGKTQPDGSRFKVPQMGWNQLHITRPHPLWDGIADQTWFYFLHSYYADPAQSEHSVGEADYGGRFTAAVARDNLFATQFHPEKIAAVCLALYRIFLYWKP